MLLLARVFFAVYLHLLQQRSATQTVRNMPKLTAQQAQQAIAMHANSHTITAQQITAALGNASVTFAQLLYVTQVQLAAQHRGQCIQKVTSANVILCSNVTATSHVYARKVQRSALGYAQNAAAAIAAFTAQQNYYTHTPCYSIVQHAQHAEKLYLYALYNTASSVYMHNNAVVSKQQVAQYCTPSAAAKLLQDGSEVHNKTHNIVHNVHVRTIALSNLVHMRVRKQLLTV